MRLFATILFFLSLISCKQVDNGCIELDNKFKNNEELRTIYSMSLLDVYLLNCYRYLKFPSFNPTDSISFGELDLILDSLNYSNDSVIISLYFDCKTPDLVYTEEMKQISYDSAIQNNFGYTNLNGFNKETAEEYDKQRCYYNFGIGFFSSVHYSRYINRRLYLGTNSTLQKYYEFAYGYSRFENPFQKDVLDYLKKNYSKLNPTFKCLLEERFPNWRNFKAPMQKEREL